MIKKFIISSVLSAITFVFIFSDHKSERLSVMKVLDRKNPYDRKPASIIDEKIEVEKEIIEEEVTNIYERIGKLKVLKSCYVKRCDIAETDPREYSLTVGQKIKNELIELYEEVLQNELLDSQVDEVAHTFISINDGHVKEAALLLFSTQNPSDKNLKAIVKNIINYHDANLIGLAMMELEKYQSPSHRELIAKSFVENFKNGSLLVRQEIAKGLYRFVNQENRNQFEEILNSLPKNSRVRRNIKASLERYDYNVRL